MAQIEGRSGDSPVFAAGNKQLAGYAGVQEEAPKVHALAERLSAIGVDDGKPVANSMAVNEVGQRIKVQTLTGRVIQVYVQPTDAVGRIKELLEENEGIPPEQQRLILGGKQLVDGKTVRESKITADSVIHLVLALRGGRCNN